MVHVLSALRKEMYSSHSKSLVSLALTMMYDSARAMKKSRALRQERGSASRDYGVFTGLALTVIRLSYFKALGPDPDPNGVYRHCAIDFTGNGVSCGCSRCDRLGCRSAEPKPAGMTASLPLGLGSKTARNLPPPPSS